MTDHSQAHAEVDSTKARQHADVDANAAHNKAVADADHVHNVQAIKNAAEEALKREDARDQGAKANIETQTKAQHEQVDKAAADAHKAIDTPPPPPAPAPNPGIVKPATPAPVAASKQPVPAPVTAPGKSRVGMIVAAIVVIAAAIALAYFKSKL